MPFDSDYKYIDLEYLYTDKDSGVLLNKQNIKDHKELVAFESLCVARRSEQLLKMPIKIDYAIDNHSVYERYMDDTINGKVDDLTDLIYGLLK